MTKILNISSYGKVTSAIKQFALYVNGGRNVGTNPQMVWHNGSTYAVGYESIATNNTVIVYKQTGQRVEANYVNNGTTVQEPLGHPTPAIIVDNAGYVYVIQNEFHISPFKVWKSTNPEDISSFVYLGTFSANLAYLNLQNQNNTICTFVSREGSYNQKVIRVNLSNLSVSIDRTITNNNYGTTNIRHYSHNTIKYGNSEYTIGGINHRKDGSIVYYKTSLWATKNYDEFFNIPLTYSKVVSTQGTITDTQLEANYKIVGTDSNLSFNVSNNTGIQINNDYYMLVRTGVFTYAINKYTLGMSGVQASFTIPMELFETSQGENYNFLYFNGRNIIIISYDVTNNTHLSTIDLDLNNYYYERKLSKVTERNFGFPINFDVVPRYKKYMMLATTIGVAGNAAYTITDNKWYK